MGKAEVRGGGSSVESGATIVECAIVIPLFLLFVVAILEFARFIANRSQIESALRKAGEYGATLDGDCLTPTRDRFFEVMEVLKSGSVLTFSGKVVPFMDGAQALQIVVIGEEPSLLAHLNFGVRSVGLFPIEIPGGCRGRMEMVSTQADVPRSARSAD